MRTRVDVLSPKDNRFYELVTRGIARIVRQEEPVNGVVKKRRRVNGQLYEVSAPVKSRALFSRGPRVTEVTIEKSDFDNEDPILKISMRGNGELRICFTDDYLSSPDFARIDLAGVRIEAGRNVIEVNGFGSLQPQTRDVLYGEVRKAFYGI